MPTSKTTRPTAPDGQWAVLAREYESQLKALCESDDPISLLADFCVQAGLPEPKAATSRSRIECVAEEHKTDAEFWKHNAEERASELAPLRSRVAEMETVLRVGIETFAAVTSHDDFSNSADSRKTMLELMRAALAPLPPGSAA